MKYSEIKDALERAQLKTKKKMAEFLQGILPEGFTVYEGSDPYKVYANYKGISAFSVQGTHDYGPIYGFKIKSYCTGRRKVLNRYGFHDYVNPVEDTDADVKRCERELVRIDFFKSNPFVYGTWGTPDDPFANGPDGGTRTRRKMLSLLSERNSYRRDIEDARLPYSIGYYLEELADMGPRGRKYNKQKFLEELPKVYTKVLDLMAKENASLVKRLQDKEAEIRNYIEERKNRRIF